MTKPVHGCNSCWSRSFGEIVLATPARALRASSGVGCSRNIRNRSVASSRSPRAGGVAYVTRPMARPMTIGSTPDFESATQAAVPSSAQIAPRRTPSLGRAMMRTKIANAIPSALRSIVAA